MTFGYGSDKSRKVQRIFENGALKETKYYINPLFEITVNAATGAVKEYAYIIAEGKVRAIQESNAQGANPEWYVLRYDHLGSIDYVTRANGSGLRNLDYQVWGSHRNPYTGSLSTALEPRTGNRGFTGHEHLAMNRIVHMNGRLYDPTLCFSFHVCPICSVCPWLELIATIKTRLSVHLYCTEVWRLGSRLVLHWQPCQP